MKYLLLIVAILLAGCSHKVVVKDCDETKGGTYFVCDTFLFK